ncbi:hypothetical protein FT663_05505 [Candidozyma haemuli var. vulneris]|uniref:Thioredoxin domain-containing protein n=1 Tax=Candidozyma haemuli TaxID=45357 RepID=A0A2V1AUV3_9ASCO|nr:hypothetical protein CXQ85_004554 [[Candida] haemuloni]KAF3984905.1 hypothetical protein FT663_05505 [[Candida] haemuloni var. vulneris]PVH21890.1 hypothetical protein CXQ85_004554 [[Candida] haemuloni]
MPVTNFETLKEFDDILKQSERDYVFVYFSGEGCQPCEKLGPYYDKFADEFGEAFFKIENRRGDNSTNSPKQKANVEVFPTFLLYEAGLELGRLLTNSPNQLKEWIKLHVSPPGDD